MKKAVLYARKIGVLLIGLPLFAVGIILIPLPGPGLLVCFAALFILSLEFEWAKPYLERVKTEYKKIMEKSKERSDKLSGKK